ncbi:hypothetical protein DV20_14045 [Amycolatopsis rifamycinica]|uniref:Tyr recombinase domain-containing protein n=1 Tax=Amycolatopsis rifamycinica TaxID=287986 RepID=A0A066U6W5_9PSEU|nr:hypothetical protein DV20_14045 [Amycolatopsis rifamycinica]
MVINPQQAKSLLSEVEAQRIDGQPRRSSGPMPVALFAVMYYAALRPQEAAMLRKSDLHLPDVGRGELLLSETAPIASAAWTDSGGAPGPPTAQTARKGEVRAVPWPPPLRAILQTTLGTAADGRLFRNLTGGDLAESTIGRGWGAHGGCRTVDGRTPPDRTRSAPDRTTPGQGLISAGGPLCPR